MRRLFNRGMWICLCGSLVLAGCRHQPEAEKAPVAWQLFSGEMGARWQRAEMERGGEMLRDGEEFVLQEGTPMSGMVYPGWVQEGLPIRDYRVTYETMRVQGGDFFGSLTFPVGSVERCITFVLGGWGGSQVGLSSIDGLDAAQNVHGSSQRFESGRWYKIRIEVRKDLIQVWLDDAPIINANIRGQQVTLRNGDIDLCVPFGFATFRTEARLRNCRVERLAP